MVVLRGLFVRCCGGSLPKLNMGFGRVITDTTRLGPSTCSHESMTGSKDGGVDTLQLDSFRRTGELVKLEGSDEGEGVRFKLVGEGEADFLRRAAPFGEGDDIELLRDGGFSAPWSGERGLCISGDPMLNGDILLLGEEL